MVGMLPLAASDITLTIGDVKVGTVGETVHIPLTIDYISPGEEIGGWQLFIGFDHEILTWDGFMEDPDPGISYLNPLFLGEYWTFGVTPGSELYYLHGGQVNLDTVTFPVTVVVFTFIYNGGLTPGDVSPLIWGTSGKAPDNLNGKGTTEAYTWEEFDYFVLTLNDGSVYMTATSDSLNEITGSKYTSSPHSGFKTGFSTENPFFSNHENDNDQRLDIPYEPGCSDLSDGSLHFWSSDQTVFITGLNTHGEIRIYNLSGQLILNKPLEPGSLNRFQAGNFRGCCIVRVNSGSHTASRKVIIQ